MKAKKVKKSSACAVWHGAAAEKSKFTEAKMVCPRLHAEMVMPGFPKGNYTSVARCPIMGYVEEYYKEKS